MNRAIAGALAAGLILTSCFSGASAPGARRQGGSAPGVAVLAPIQTAAARTPIDRRNPAITETATFALG